MRKRKSGNSQVSNIYEATISLSNRDHNKCPFTGLPAVHLKLMCSPMTGLLTRLERKFLFGQSKDFYVGILDKWILLYPSKSNDMKPTEHFFPKSVNKVKGENQFVIVTNNDKRFHFLAPNSHEYTEWIDNINRIIDDIREGKVKDSPVPQQLRKLPSPPTDKKNMNNETEVYYSFGGSICKSINSNEERLYEEPCSASLQSGEKETPPKLPLKKGKQLSSNDNDQANSYDTPKSTKVLENETQKDTDITSSSSSPAEIQNNEGDYDVPPRVTVSEMTAMLSGINLVSPEEKRKSTTRKSVEVTQPSVDSDKKESSKSPVKWFKKRIMRGKRFSLKDKRDAIVEVDEDEEEDGAMTNDEEVVGRGSKVNMIINQLEKSGQLKALKKGFKSRKSLNYECESICVKN